MKSCKLFLLFFFIPFVILGQSGFSKTYDFDSGASFHNIITKEDTLIIVGTTKDLTTNQWGALFVKMDTLGNILDYKLHLDTMAGQYVFNIGYSFITTSDGGYLMTGALFNRDSYFLLKMDINGDLLYFKEYPHPDNIWTSQPKKLIEVNEGYLIIGDKQLSNGMSSIFVKKVNLEGNIIWEEFYGETNNSHSLGSVWMEHENSFVIGCSRGAGPPPVPSPVNCAQNWIFAIDSLGDVQWEWVGEPCEGDAVIGLQRTDEGGWIYGTRQFQAFDLSNWGTAPKIVKRDNDFNLIWERKVAESYWYDNRIVDLKRSPSGDWIGVGSWVLPEPYNPTMLDDFFYLPGCLNKVSDQGDSLWIRCDTITTLDNPTEFHRLASSIILPSGSVIAVGRFKEEILGGPDKSWAWVIKTDKDGCIEELCTMTSTQNLEMQFLKNIQLFPNPVIDQLTIEIDQAEPIIVTHLEIFDTHGKLIQTSTGNAFDQTTNHWELDTSDLLPGVFILLIHSDIGVYQSRFIKT